MTIDGRNMVGPWVIGVRESESGYRFGVKGQKNIGFGKNYLLTIDDRNMVGPWVIGVREPESGYRFGSKVKRTSVLVTTSR